jgi:hypothetical protein
MRFDGGAINQNLRGQSAGLRERVKQIDPHAFGCPAHIAIVERFPRPVFGRRVDPSAARFQHMNDAADRPSIIDARLAAYVGRQMWLNPRKLRVRQPTDPDPSLLPFEAVNHNSPVTPTLLWVRTLELETTHVRARARLKRTIVVHSLGEWHQRGSSSVHRATRRSVTILINAEVRPTAVMSGRSLYTLFAAVAAV